VTEVPTPTHRLLAQHVHVVGPCSGDRVLVIYSDGSIGRVGTDRLVAIYTLIPVVMENKDAGWFT
jgi:hypothetical protein